MKKIVRLLSNFGATAAMCAAMVVPAFADPKFNEGAPANVNTDSMDGLVTIVFWAVRIIIGAAGGIPSIIKIVQGQTDENPRDRNSGIAGVVATGVGVAATFALQAMF